MTSMRVGHVLAAAAFLAVPAAAPAQRLAERVRAVGNGTVRVSFAARPGVCGSGEGVNIRRGDEGNMHVGRLSHDSDWDCEYGPVRVALGVRDGQVSTVRSYVGGRWRSSTDGVDLGEVSPVEAAAFLMEVAQRAEGRAAHDAILPAVLADSATIWPALLRIARNEDRPRDARRQAVFWLGEVAGDSAAARLGAVAEEATDREVRKAAIFALSQRPRDEGIPALIRVARTSRDPELRRQALFWLGQSNDPRALDLFEELLTRR